MTFDPFNPTTWHDDPDDFIVPSHELESISATAQADADEEAQVRAFLGLDRWEVDEETKQEALRQVMESRQAIRDALQKLQDAEDDLVEQTLQDAEESQEQEEES